MCETPTIQNSRTLQSAYNFFNRELFARQLPQAMVTLHRYAKANGYFHAEQFNRRADASQRTDEIALNPDTFKGRTDADILSTLVHEMVHQWQHHFGKPPKEVYHDRQWATKMQEVGLQPLALDKDGQPTGKQTGKRVTHCIIADGPFYTACLKLQGLQFRLHWEANPVPEEAKEKAEKKKASKTKYTCPACEQNAWAKPDAMLVCGFCYDSGEGSPEMMMPEE